MIQIKATPFTRKVKVKFPCGDGIKSESFSATFKVLSTKELNAITDHTDIDGQNAILRQVVLGFADVMDGDKPVSFSKASLEQILDNPFITKALMESYGEGLQGEPVKN